MKEREHNCSHVELVIRNLSFEDFKNCIIAFGEANAPELNQSIIDGLYFYYGMRVDPDGLIPQPLWLLKVEIETGVFHVVTIGEERRVFIASSQGVHAALNLLHQKQIQVQWKAEAHDAS